MAWFAKDPWSHAQILHPAPNFLFVLRFRPFPNQIFPTNASCPPPFWPFGHTSLNSIQGIPSSQADRLFFGFSGKICVFLANLSIAPPGLTNHYVSQMIRNRASVRLCRTSQYAHNTRVSDTCKLPPTCFKQSGNTVRH